MSGLGFSKQESMVSSQQELDEDDLALHNIQIPTVGAEDLTQERISFSQTQERYEARKIASAPEKPQKPSAHPSKKTQGNISIGQSTYKAKDKPVAAATDFSKFQQPSPETPKKETAAEFFAGHIKTSKPSAKKEAPGAKQTPPPKVQKEATTSANLVKKTEVTIDETITVKEFSEKIGVPLPDVMKKLISNGIMTSLNANLDFDTASLIAEDLGVSLKKKEATLDVQSFMEGDLQKILDIDKEAQHQIERAPIVTVM